MSWWLRLVRGCACARSLEGTLFVTNWWLFSTWKKSNLIHTSTLQIYFYVYIYLCKNVNAGRVGWSVCMMTVFQPLRRVNSAETASSRSLRAAPSRNKIYLTVGQCWKNLRYALCRWGAKGLKHRAEVVGAAPEAVTCRPTQKFATFNIIQHLVMSCRFHATRSAVSHTPGFQVLTAVVMESCVLCDITPCKRYSFPCNMPWSLPHL
jgi:hypothetical protein